eukprot:3892812-Prorocentrum_lima.AAC.1
MDARSARLASNMSLPPLVNTSRNKTKKRYFELHQSTGPSVDVKENQSKKQLLGSISFARWHPQ